MWLYYKNVKEHFPVFKPRPKPRLLSPAQSSTSLREMGEKVTKKNLLAIYGAAHICALTPEIILPAFQKTGVWPYDPGIITPAMMAPSLETSCEATLPIVPPMLVQLLTNLICKVKYQNLLRLLSQFLH